MKGCRMRRLSGSQYKTSPHPADAQKTYGLTQFSVFSKNKDEVLRFFGFCEGRKIRIFVFLCFGIFIDIFLFQVRVFVLEFSFPIL
jgi:hypothetical protein